MTLIEVIDAARSLLNEPLASSRTFPDNTSSFWTDAILTTYHNLIQQEVQQELIQTFEDLFVTQTTLNVVAGTAEYSLPTNHIKLRRVEDVRASEPSEILPVRLNHRERDDVRVTITAGGNGYYLRGSQIVLTDTPTYTNASAIRLHYIHRLADVTTGTASSELPAETHRALVWGIVKLALFQQQTDNTLANAEYQNHLNKLRQQAENRQIQRPRSVVKTVERGFL
jgi:hypothetical protein